MPELSWSRRGQQTDTLRPGGGRAVGAAEGPARGRAEPAAGSMVRAGDWSPERRSARLGVEAEGGQPSRPKQGSLQAVCRTEHRPTGRRLDLAPALSGIPSLLEMRDLLGGPKGCRKIWASSARRN